ncbi:uncharacterized protein [Ptychodera flava]|uniref:uncharacterized protein n=1 Tax=Ptychodera flava TaxID=63121 RepID=UPI00396A0F4C
MAAEPNNNLYDDERNIVRVQAIFRGALVRKQFKELKAAYEEIVQDIDNGGQHVTIEWPSHFLCKPSVHIGKHAPVNKKKGDSVSYNPGDNRNCESVKIFEDSQAKNVEKENVIFDETLHSGSSEGSKSGSVVFDENLDHCNIGNTYSSSFDRTPKGRQVLADIKDSPTMNGDHTLHDAWADGENDKENKSPFASNTPKPKVTEDLVLRGEVTGNVTVHIDNDEELSPMPFDPDNAERKDKISSENVTMDLQRDSDKSSEITESDKNIDNSSTDEKEKDSQTVDGENLNAERGKCHDNTMEVTRDVDMTSFWGTEQSFAVTGLDESVVYPESVDDLQKMRSNVAMELLWVQQAISSRKNYLRLKKKIGNNHNPSAGKCVE